MKSLSLFILRYGVEASNDAPDYSLIQYSPHLQLNVVTGTDEPAVKYLPLDTDTFTKTMGEGSDPDRDPALLMLVDTTTDTRKYYETTDTDSDVSLYASIINLVDTSSLTEVRVEVTDVVQDR